MTIQEKIDALKKEFENKIAELEKQAKAEEQSRVFKPKEGEKYWCVADYGVEWDGWNCLDEDEYRHKSGNVFKTQEEALWEEQHRIVSTELKHFVQENDPRPIKEEDWEDFGVKKFFIRYNYEDKELWADDVYTDKVSNQVYASSEDTLQNAIKHIGEDRLKKYYFGVKE